MNRHKRFLYYATFLFVIVLSIVYFYPRKFSREYSGVIYRLGVSSYSENVTIGFDGYLQKRLFKGDKFQGVINIGNKKLTKINMEFNSSRRADIVFYDESLGEYQLYGGMVSNDIKDRFTICVLESVDGNNGDGSWSSKNGLMISAPANNRRKALDISNKLMRDILNSMELE